MNEIWKRWAIALVVFLCIGTVVEALSCSALANAMFSSKHRAVYWAKRYYAAGCGFAVALNLPVSDEEDVAEGLRPGGESDSTGSTENVDDDLARATKAFLEKDYEGN